MPHHTDPGKQRKPIGWQHLRRTVLLVEVLEMVAARQRLRAGAGHDGDLRAAPDGADLEPGPVIGEGIRPALIGEPDEDQELRRHGVAVVDVADLREIELVPAVRAIGGVRVPLVAVLNPIAERIARGGQFPRKDPRRVYRVGDGCRIAPVRRCCLRTRRAVVADETVFAPDLPMVAASTAETAYAGKQAFGPGKVTS